MSALYDAIKHIASEFESNQDHAIICFGIVQEEDPIRIDIDSKLMLTEEFLTIAEHLTDYEAECEMETNEINDFFIEKDGKVGVQVQQGKGEQKGKLVIKNKLKKSDRVILMRMEGGQHFIVLDRIGGQ